MLGTDGIEEMFRGDYKLIPIKIIKDGRPYQLVSNENIMFTLKDYSWDKEYLIQKDLDYGITWNNTEQRYEIELERNDTNNFELEFESKVFDFDIVVILSGMKPYTIRKKLRIIRDITRNEHTGGGGSLTPEQIQALNEIIINLDDNLQIIYDDTVLNIDFWIDGNNLIIDNNLDGADFNINNNGELEVRY